MDYRIGFGEAVITPKHPMRLSGYSFSPRVSTGVHDEVKVKCCVIADDHPRLVLLSYDVLGVDARFPQWIAAALNHPAITQEHIICAATHTHSGPIGTFAAPSHNYDVDKEYVAFVLEQTVASIRTALHQCQRFAFKSARFMMEGVFTNRHDPQLFVDRRVVAYEIKLDDDTRALVYSFACHPTVLKEDNLLFAADLIGGVERALPEYGIHMFFNGLAGDSSTRFTRETSDFAQIDRFGHEVAKQLHDALKNTQPQQLTTVLHETFSVLMALKQADDREYTLAKQADILRMYHDPALSIPQKRVLETALQGIDFALKHSGSAARDETITFACHAFRLNDLCVTTVPCELFSTLFAAVLEPNSKDFVITTTNGYLSYVTDRKAFANDYYESFLSPFSQGEGEKLRDLLMKKMNHLKDDSKA